MVVLDTHALIWWTLDPQKLSPRAAAACHAIDLQGALLSAISLWEIGIKIKNGALDIGMSLDEYLFKLYELGSVTIFPVDEKVWLESLKLDWDHRDPADRVIVATALLHNRPIVTKDEKIQKFYGDTIW